MGSGGGHACTKHHTTQSPQLLPAAGGCRRCTCCTHGQLCGSRPGTEWIRWHAQRCQHSPCPRLVVGTHRAHSDMATCCPALHDRKHHTTLPKRLSPHHATPRHTTPHHTTPPAFPHTLTTSTRHNTTPQRAPWLSMRDGHAADQGWMPCCRSMAVPSTTAQRSSCMLSIMRHSEQRTRARHTRPPITAQLNTRLPPEQTQYPE